MDNKMKTKTFAVFAAVMMMAVAGFAIVNTSDDTDATAAGTFTVYLSTNGGSTWTPSVVNANDGAQALQASSFWASNDSVVPFDASTGQYPSLQTTYGHINMFYGQPNDHYGAVWNVFVYQNGSWVKANDALGFYKPFSDYNSAWQTANIALYYGAEATTVPSSLTSSMTSMSSITDATTSAFATTFFIQILYEDAEPTVNGTIYDDDNQVITEDSLFDGITITGYGSDAFLALKNALNTANDTNYAGYDGVPKTGTRWYGTTSYFYNLSSQVVDDKGTADWQDDDWVWWMVCNDFVDEDNHTRCPYNLGFTGVAGSGLVDNTISLVYMVAPLA